MKLVTRAGQAYRLPNSLNAFQEELYLHLINWKWAHITREPGSDRGHLYDAIVPEAFAGKYPLLYPEIVPTLTRHLEQFPFRLHTYFNHMASSQAANLNLFLPVLTSPNAAAVLSALKPDFARLAIEYLDHGFRIEFWDEPFGNLNDKTPVSGTDADLAIAYYNHQGQLCLWLIEHKLTEAEFTTCGGYKSPGRQSRHVCDQPFRAILDNPQLCYYHDVRHFNYWKITAEHAGFFQNHTHFGYCPFQGGLNQLWRNQLLGLSIEPDRRQPYQQVTFSVVRHPRNPHLDQSLANYRNLIASNPKFTVFTSGDVITAAAGLQTPDLEPWVAWYRNLYAL